MKESSKPAKSTGSLSEDDITRLMTDRSARVQMDIVEKLAGQYMAEGEEALSPEQTAIANDIFRLLLSHGEMIVRAMMAANLSQTTKLPPELARQMASDSSNEVASPVLQYSDVLADADLLNIIGSIADAEKLQAIARRGTVSEKVSDELAGTNLDAVVNTLVQNEGAQITEQTFEKIAKHHSDNAQIVDSIFQRKSVPVGVVEKVIERLSVVMRRDLEKKYGSLADMKAMKKALEQSLELTGIRMMGFTSSDQELTQLLRKLDENNKLSPFAALCMGNLQLFEISLSRLLRVPVHNVHILVQDAKGFRMLYDRAELPASLFEATLLALHAIRGLEEESRQKTGKPEIPHALQVIERMRVLAAGKKVEGLDRLFAMMEHCQQS